MKYGVIVYIQTDNIGDDILSYAGMKYLPHVDYVIDRESLDTFCPKQKEYVSVIMNGWFLFNKFNWPPSPYINPKIIGIHFSNNNFRGIGDEYLDGLGQEYLKKNSPIGCRDTGTMEKMMSRNISAYLSGCLTLTLSKFKNVENTDKYVLVDVPDILADKMQKELGPQRIERFSHFVIPSERGAEWSIRCERVENILKKYQGARLVITTRLHCALPCLALGTPVILIEETSKDYTERKSDFSKYLRCYSLDKILHLNVHEMGNFQNGIEFYDMRSKLIEECERFVNECENLDEFECSKGLPDVQTFQNLFSNKIAWQKSLQKSEQMSISKVNYEELIETKRWLDNQYVSQVQRIKELENYNEELLTAKKWLNNQYESQSRRIRELECYNQELLIAKKWLETQNKIKADRIDELESWCKELEEGKEWLEEKWKEAIANKS